MLVSVLQPRMFVARLLAIVVEWLFRHRRMFVVALHLGLIVLSSYLAMVLRFDGAIPKLEFETWRSTIVILLLLRSVAFVPLGLYQGLWRYTSVWDLQRIVVGVAASTALYYVLVSLILRYPHVPRSVLVIDSVLLIGLMGGARLVRRIFHEVNRIAGTKRILIYGAGDAGELIVRDMRNNPFYKCNPIGFVDDDRAKVGSTIHGVPVLGSRADLGEIINETESDELLIAMPREEIRVIRNIVRTLRPFKIPISILPSLPQVMSGKVTVTHIRPLAIEDLLERPQADMDLTHLHQMIGGKRVLVTGAGGSIGSELCRQVVDFAPESLAMVERHENSLYAIATDLADHGHANVMCAYVADITDRARIRKIMATFQPHIVFHAAAHKHVPMMELNPCEAVKNNVGGTRIVLEEAADRGVERFVLISTDKAVNPTSVMGATKRVAEFCVQVAVDAGDTNVCVVRFGNVLGSSGSVVPRFLAQIKAGGPVSVTDPEMRRYFMLIPEAVQLVLQATAHASPGAVYVLEMGEQIKVVDMARNLIRLSGYVPDEEIKIDFVGLRPGEKLFEELIGNDEVEEATSMSEVRRVVAKGHRPVMELRKSIEMLEYVASRDDGEEVIRNLRLMIPTFKPTLETPDETVAFPRVGEAPSAFDSLGVDIALR